MVIAAQIRSGWASRKEALEAFLRCRFAEGEYRTAAGILLSLGNPLITLAILNGVFSRHFSDGIRAYPLTLLIGIVCVNYVIQAAGSVMVTLRQNRETVLNSSLPRECLLFAEFLYASVKLGLELSLCFFFAAGVGELSISRLPLLIPAVLGLGAFTFGLGLVMSLLYCLFRDMQHIWTLGSRILFFITPVFYPLDALSDQGALWLRTANPLTSFVLTFRAALMKSYELDTTAAAQSMLWGMLSLTAGALAFYLWQAKCSENL